MLFVPLMGYAHGGGLYPPDVRQLAPFFQSAKQGDAEAQYKVGRWWFANMRTTRDAEQARYWLEQAAEQGHAKAQTTLGLLHEMLDEEKKAIYWYRKAAEQGDADAQQQLQRLGATSFFGLWR